MIKKIVNAARGYAEVRVECAFPERFINYCALNGIEIWDIERVDGITVRVRVPLSALKAALKFSKRGGEATVDGRRGLPAFLWRFRRRWALIAGFLALSGGLLFLSAHVWEFEVTGNERVPAAAILRELSALGVDVGVRADKIDNNKLHHLMILAIPELEWITVNVNGSAATVEVRERVPKPDIVDQRLPANIISSKAGMIIEMNTLAGRAVRRVGDSVAAGDLLVSGIIDSETVGARKVHALANVKLRTWYSITAVLPEKFASKSYTGKSKTRRAVSIGGKRINFYKNTVQNYAFYDKLEERVRLTIPPGISLPVEFISETHSEYTPYDYTITRQSAEDFLQNALTERLAAIIGETGEAVSVKFATTLETGVWKCVMSAECVENAAIEAKLE